MEKLVNVPKERISIARSCFNRIRKLGVGIELEDNCCVIDGDAIGVMAAENIMRAVGRGFPPEEAFKLENDEITLVVITLPKDGKSLLRIRSRLIGTLGKTRRTLEQLTGTKICIYGKTASVIGSYESAEIATAAIEKLINGASHKNVYAFLERLK